MMNDVRDTERAISRWRGGRAIYRLGRRGIADILADAVTYAQHSTVLPKKPDVFSVLVSSIGYEIYPTSNWNSLDQFLKILNGSKSGRKQFNEVVGLLSKVAGTFDLSVWSDTYSTGRDDVIGLFVQAADLAADQDL